MSEKPNPPLPPVLPSRSWSAVCPGLTCLCFFALTAHLLGAYGLLHWRIIGDNYAALNRPLKSSLFSLLARLEVYHVTALLTFGFGVWTFFGQPGWIRWVCLPLMGVSLVMFMVVM